MAEVAQSLAAAGEGDLPVGQVEVVERQASDGSGASGVLGGQGDDDSSGEVVGLLLMARISSSAIGSRAKSAGRPFSPVVGLEKIRPRFLANPNSDLRALVVVARREPLSGPSAALMSERVTSRRWSGRVLGAV
ncbi:hypothetical protein ACSDR0_47340 [Streptosporangium sp. G11]|uniref:hypothetical protein n=1 Tax=Streptosporangium sp. G11 TaxID=3436926 RepID=UPI003EB8C6B3